MPFVAIDSGDVLKVSERIAKLLADTENLEPVMEQAAEYMQRSTINRILRTKRGPDGERWAALAEVTVELKGHDRPLFETGELSRSIEITDVSSHGFELTAETPYASYMQNGVAKMRAITDSRHTEGMGKGSIPARPFMGFSSENIKRITKMISDYLAHGG
jgi:phage virion morphogenesis protein